MYGYYLEGYGNGVLHRESITARSMALLERRTKAYHVKNGIQNVGSVLYQFNPAESLKYRRDSYRILKQHNAKAFFQFWE